MLGDLLFAAVVVVGVPLFAVYAAGIWLGLFWRRRILRLSRRRSLWLGRYGQAAFLIAAPWLALALVVVEVTFVLRLRGDAAAAFLAPAAIPFVLWLLVTNTERPRWALPPWYRRATAGHAARHRNRVHYVADAAHGTAPYYIALCSCGWVGEPFDVATLGQAAARQRAFHDAATHAVPSEEVASNLDREPAMWN